MPVYLVHGFRWARLGYTGIRAFTTLNNLEDCSSEYIQNEASKVAILQAFRQQFAQIMQRVEDQSTGKILTFVEQYDPRDESTENAASQPYAFVAAHVITIAAGASPPPREAQEEAGERSADAIQTPTATKQSGSASASAASSSKDLDQKASPPIAHSVNPEASALCLNVEEVIANGSTVAPQTTEALAELRDKIAEGEKIGWWIVYNGDPERAVNEHEAGTESDSDHDGSVEDEAQNDLTETDSLFEGGVLGQPLPTLIPRDMTHLVVERGDKDIVGTAKSHTSAPEEHAQNPAQSQGLPKTENVPLARPKGSKSSFTSNFSFPLRRKSSKVSMPQQKSDDVSEPSTLKEINKKEGRRYKFFGGRSEKKAA